MELHLLLWAQIPWFLRLMIPQTLYYLLIVKFLGPLPGLDLHQLKFQYLQTHQNHLQFQYFLSMVQVDSH